MRKLREAEAVNGVDDIVRVFGELPERVVRVSRGGPLDDSFALVADQLHDVKNGENEAEDDPEGVLEESWGSQEDPFEEALRGEPNEGLGEVQLEPVLALFAKFLRNVLVQKEEERRLDSCVTNCEEKQVNYDFEFVNLF